jgi:outer membrane protein OmpA-like peptidoglycan-associated protein
LWFEKKAYFDKEVHFTLQSDSLENDTTYRLTYCMEVFKPDEITATPEQITDPTKVSKVVEAINKSDTVTVHFDFNKTDLTQEAVEQLDKFLAVLKTYPTISIQLNIIGGADALGTDEVNFRIGRQRALNCLGYVIQRGISESRLKLTSIGKTRPVAPDFINGKDNPAGRAKNRRVEMKANAKIIQPENTTPARK